MCSVQHECFSPCPVKVSEWHKKLEEARLQELRKNRELGALKEEIRYLKNIVAEQEHTISSLEEELVQQNNVRLPLAILNCTERYGTCKSYGTYFLLFSNP